MSRRASFRRYCRVVLARPQSRYLHVPGRNQISLETDDIFVPLTVSSTSTSQRDHVEYLYSLLNEPDSARFVQIVGDPGSGKSSLVKHIFRAACSQSKVGSGRWARRHPPLLPIVIELKSFVPPTDLEDSELADWALSEVRRQVTDVHGFAMGTLFESSSTGDGLLVLLDGLDEVSSDRYRPTSQAILGLCRLLSNRSPRNKVVMTMRSQFHSQIREDFDQTFVVTWEIQPFNPSDIIRFLRAWPFKSDASGQILRIYAELTDRPTLREMCSNPLVLAMYVANDQATDKTASPGTRTEFYAQVLEELLVARRSRQVGQSARQALRLRREAFLGRIARNNLADEGQPANVISWADAIETMVQMEGCLESDAERRLLELCKETGVLGVERLNESLRFIHLTFCEFLAAKEYALGRVNGWPELVVSHNDFVRSKFPQVRSRLVEVVPFAVALLPPSQRDVALGEVWAIGQQGVMGRCLLETQLYSNPLWIEYVEAELQFLSQMDEAPEVQIEWLRRLHLLNVTLIDYADWCVVAERRPEIDGEEVLARLVTLRVDQFNKVFASYASTDAAAAFRLSERLGINLVKERPDIVVDQMADALFVLFCRQKAAEVVGDDQLLWTWVFAEATARVGESQILMMDADTPEWMLRRARRVTRSRRWYPVRPSLRRFVMATVAFSVRNRLQRLGVIVDAWKRRYGRPSLAESALTVALDEAEQPRWLRDLSAFYDFRPPGRQRLREAVIVLLAVLVIVVYLVSETFLFVVPSPLAIWVVASSVVILLTYPGARREIYFGVVTGMSFNRYRTRHERYVPGRLLIPILDRSVNEHIKQARRERAHRSVEPWRSTGG
ncbi:MAG TPA: NACHT domain-containing protein [Acidimicrobiales bacterium]|nr:NACHT domain-containing protein [Acidimicrobiales bacterium]